MQHNCQKTVTLVMSKSLLTVCCKMLVYYYLTPIVTMKAVIISAIICFIVCTCAVESQMVPGDINHIYGRLYVGNYRAGKDIKGLMTKYNITAVLNVAWDLDIRYDNYMVPPGYRMIIQANKVGLVDGTGNNMATLASALYVLDQYLVPRDLEGKDNSTYPAVRNVLVHCNKGQSRSVVVTALYLYYKSGKFTSFDDALLFVKDKRGLSGDNEVPDPNILALAQQLSSVDVFSLFSSGNLLATHRAVLHASQDLGAVGSCILLAVAHAWYDEINKRKS